MQVLFVSSSDFFAMRDFLGRYDVVFMYDCEDVSLLGLAFMDDNLGFFRLLGVSTVLFSFVFAFEFCAFVRSWFAIRSLSVFAMLSFAFPVSFLSYMVSGIALPGSSENHGWLSASIAEYLL